MKQIALKDFRELCRAVRKAQGFCTYGHGLRLGRVSASRARRGDSGPLEEVFFVSGEWRCGGTFGRYQIV